MGRVASQSGANGSIAAVSTSSPRRRQSARVARRGAGKRGSRGPLAGWRRAGGGLAEGARSEGRAGRSAALAGGRRNPEGPEHAQAREPDDCRVCGSRFTIAPNARLWILGILGSCAGPAHAAGAPVLLLQGWPGTPPPCTTPPPPPLPPVRRMRPIYHCAPRPVLQIPLPTRQTLLRPPPSSRSFAATLFHPDLAITLSVLLPQLPQP